MAGQNWRILQLKKDYLIKLYKRWNKKQKAISAASTSVLILQMTWPYFPKKKLSGVIIQLEKEEKVLHRKTKYVIIGKIKNLLAGMSILKKYKSMADNFCL